MRQFKLGGIVAAPYTAFDADGALNLAAVQRQAEALVHAGVVGAFVCGTTGEGMSLTTAERMDVARRWTEVAGGRLKIVVHVGHNSQRDAVALAAHARQVDAAAVAALPPFFYKPANVEQVVEFMRPVAAAAGDLPFYYYHIPSMTGVALSMVELLRIAADRIPTLRGIKFTHGDLMEFQCCRAAAGGGFEIAWGFDEMLLGALAVGAEAAVGSTYNYAAPLYQKMIRSFHAGDHDTARACSQTAGEMVAVLLEHGVLRAGKAAMRMIGADCGPPRPPVPPLGPQSLAAVRAAFERLGVLDWAKGRSF